MYSRKNTHKLEQNKNKKSQDHKKNTHRAIIMKS